MVRCRVGIQLTAEEIARLEALPMGANVIVPERWCSLESGHAGSPFALGQSSGDEEFWIQWVEGDSQIVVLEPRPSEAPRAQKIRACCMPGTMAVMTSGGSQVRLTAR
jgi:hypothetical protein